MARVSKKVSAARQEAENAQHRVWKAAIYARLSDFDDALRDAESLEVQISYIKEYINHRDDLMLLDVFADKRCTGMNFDRPEFERLLKALQERKIDCIVVKDFSRLGRNFVETGQYLEQVFPLFGVRFIAINDNYDSLNSQSRDGMLVPIKSMINEMYSKDLSQKIQSCFRSKEARGEIYMPVPFGYKRNQQNHLILDEEVSDVGAKFIMPVPCKHRVLRAPLEQQVRIEDSHAAIVTPEKFEQAQMVIMLQNGNHQSGNYTKHQYPLKGKVYCGYCQKLMKYRVLKKLGPSFNCRFSATAVDSPCKRILISEELLEEIVRNALTVQIKQAEHVLEILHERERKALICFSALERQEEKLSAEKAELVKLRVALYEQYADGNMSKEEFIRQRDAYRVQEDDKMEQIQRLRTEKNQIFQPVKKDTDNLQAVMNTVGEAGDVMHLSQNVVETFIDRIEVFNDECVKIRFTFEDTLKSYETG